MTIDSINNEFYNTYADSFDKIPFEDILISLILKHASKSSQNVLEIGSGAGALALWMANQGHHVTCLEPAQKPAEKAREKGLKVYQMRFQDFPADRQFDSLLAISSLIHIPRSDMPSQIKKMSACLKPEGVAFVSFIEGNEEGYEDPTGKGKMRYFSKFTQQELNAYLLPYFSIIDVQKIEVKKMQQVFLLMVLKRVSLPDYHKASAS